MILEIILLLTLSQEYYLVLRFSLLLSFCSFFSFSFFPPLSWFLLSDDQVVRFPIFSSSQSCSPLMEPIRRKFFVGLPPFFFGLPKYRSNPTTPPFRRGPTEARSHRCLISNRSRARPCREFVQIEDPARRILRALLSTFFAEQTREIRQDYDRSRQLPISYDRWITIEREKRRCSSSRDVLHRQSDERSSSNFSDARPRTSEDSTWFSWATVGYENRRHDC